LDDEQDLQFASEGSGFGTDDWAAAHAIPKPVQLQGLTFLLFLMVTRVTPGTGFMPSFCIALRLFFSERDCLPRPPASPSSVQNERSRDNQLGRQD
jgi:hypothetical protein